MSNWLFKEEPTHYGYDDFVKDCPNIEGCETDSKTGKPFLKLKPLGPMREALKNSFAGQAVNPAGVSLEDALRDLDGNYQKASEAVAAFNTASLSGGFEGKGSEGELAGTGTTNTDGGTGEGLNRGVAATGSRSCCGNQTGL